MDVCKLPYKRMENFIKYRNWLPGSRNILPDRQLKCGLYARRGVFEYWIVDWESEQIEVHRRQNATLELMATLFSADTLTSPLLPGFEMPIAKL